MAESPTTLMSVDSAVFDFDKALQTCFGRYDAFQRMVRCFFDRCDASLEELHSHCQDDDLNRLEREGTTSRGSSAISQFPQRCRRPSGLSGRAARGTEGRQLRESNN